MVEEHCIRDEAVPIRSCGLYRSCLLYTSNRELHQLERIVKNIDPESFVIVSEVREVRGRGFSLTKEHKSTQSEENSTSANVK